MAETSKGKKDQSFEIWEGVFRTLGILIRWGGGWLVAWHVLPAFAGKSSELLVNAIISWSIDKGAPSFLFPGAFVLAVGWAIVERRGRLKVIPILESKIKMLEIQHQPEQLTSANTSNRTESASE